MRDAQQERGREFEISRATPGAIWRLVAISLLLVGLVPLIAWDWWSATDSVVGSWIVLSCTVLAAGTGALFAREAYLALCRTVTVTAENLRVRRSLRDHVVPIERLRLDDAEVIAIGDDSRLFPTFRPNGIHVGDYWAGWFRLRNGEKGFLVLTTRDRVTHIPTRDGYRLLLSVDTPHALLNALRKQRTPTGGAHRLDS
jgi:hypothetical protein